MRRELWYRADRLSDGIAIRQLTAGVLEAAVIFPVLTAIGGRRKCASRGDPCSPDEPRLAHICPVRPVRYAGILVLVQGQFDVRRGAGHGLQLHVRVLGSTGHVAAAGRRRQRRHAAKLPANSPPPNGLARASWLRGYFASHGGNSRTDPIKRAKSRPSAKNPWCARRTLSLSTRSASL